MVDLSNKRFITESDGETEALLKIHTHLILSCQMEYKTASQSRSSEAPQTPGRFQDNDV